MMDLAKKMCFLERRNVTVALHITPYYTAIGKIIDVQHEFVVLIERDHIGKNNEVIIPINKIMYLREIK